MTHPLPAHLQKVLTPTVWESWSAEQQAYILATEGQPTNHAEYPRKTWELGATRPEHGETCAKCEFAYCFYAVPRNWSMSHSADVWNLMRCANGACQQTFESCF